MVIRKKMETPTFRFYFNKKKQWIDVYLWDVHPTTFSNWKMGRWGCFNPKWEVPGNGYFGELHFVKSRADREDLINHELLHAWIEWIWANRTAITNRNEETLVALFDEMTRNFYKEHRKQ